MKTLQQVADYLGAELVGDGAATVATVSSPELANPESLVFAQDESSAGAASRSRACAVLAREPLPAGKPTLIVPDPRLAFARAAKFLAQSQDDARQSEPRVHHTAVIGEQVLLGRAVQVDAGCVLADGVTIGAGTHLYPRVVVYSGCTIGENVTIHAGVILGADGFGYVRDPATGDYTQFPQQGTLVIEDDVEIGANTTIDRGALAETRIGRGTKIDNLVHIGHNVVIGRNVVIAAQTGISGSCSIGDGAVLGGQVGMGDHVTIGPGVILGGGCGILPHKKIFGPGELFWGTPARPVKQYLRELATLAKQARRTAPQPDPDEAESEPRRRSG